MVCSKGRLNIPSYKDGFKFRKQFKSFMKLMKLIRFTKSLPPKGSTSKYLGEILSEQFNDIEEAYQPNCL